MAVTYGFFDSVNGDRRYNADTMSEFYTGICTQGVFQHINNGLAVSAGTGLTVNVATGRALIQNHWVKNDSVKTLTVSAASATYARIDAVVIRFSKSNRSISILMKDGTAAASPSAPSMTRNSDVYEFALAYVNVAANASSVTVTDKRSDSAVCGWAAVAQAASGEVNQMLNDMKTGFDGVTYASPAAMVQGCDQKIYTEAIGIRKSAIGIYKNTDNLLKYTTWTNGKFRNAQDGTYVANANYSYSSPIYVSAGEIYNLNTAYHVCYCDENNTFKSGTYGAAKIIIPDGCTLITVSVPIADQDTAYCTLYDRDDTSKVIYGNNNNLLYNMQYEDQYYYQANSGARTYNASYSNSGLISIEPNIPVYLHNITGPHVCFYNKNKEYVSGNLNPYFSTPSDCAYMRVSIPISEQTNAIAKRYDREKCIKVGAELDMVPQNKLNYAYALSTLCNLPIYIYGGEYDIGALFGGYGFNPVNDVIGIGRPKLYVNKSSFDVNLSCFMLNRANKSITIDGFDLEVTNGRYCIHDEMGALTSGQFYTHIIKNCNMKQNTAIQQDFTYPRCIGIGLGNNGRIIIENCHLVSNVPEEIDAHTGYSGQAQGANVLVKDCVMPSGTVTASYAGQGSGFVDRTIVTNCLVNAAPHADNSDTVELISYNNYVVS